MTALKPIMPRRRRILLWMMPTGVSIENSRNGETDASNGELLFRSDPQGFHLSIKVAALESQHFGGAAHVAVVLVECFEDVVALVGVTGLMQRGELALGRAPAAFAVDQRRQMFAVETCGRWVHDHD